VEYRSLGGSELAVSEIALGTWLTLGSSIDADATRRMVEHAFGLGINFFDTADVYSDGDCEVALGRALRALPRDQVVVASKCYFASRDHPESEGLSRSNIKASVEGSLRRLDTDYIDLYQCHRADPDTPLEETLGAFANLIQAGKLRHWGVSEWSPEEIERACALARQQGAPAPISNQTEYSMLRRGVETRLLPVSSRVGVSTLAWSPLAQGVLTGKYSGGRRPEGSRAADGFRRQFMEKLLGDERAARVDGLRPFADALGISVAQLALAWCLRGTNVASLIVGATRETQLDDNAGASGRSLPAEVREGIDRLFPAPRPGSLE
jgi:aryl-alcohol dehydrogenase-like predicted oxidoreductase